MFDAVKVKKQQVSNTSKSEVLRNFVSECPHPSDEDSRLFEFELIPAWYSHLSIVSISGVLQTQFSMESTCPKLRDNPVKAGIRLTTDATMITFSVLHPVCRLLFKFVHRKQMCRLNLSIISEELVPWLLERVYDHHYETRVKSVEVGECTHVLLR